jgi:hypothetical protein
MTMRVAFLSSNVYALSDSYLLVSVLVKHNIYPVCFNMFNIALASAVQIQTCTLCYNMYMYV